MGLLLCGCFGAQGLAWEEHTERTQLICLCAFVHRAGQREQVQGYIVVIQAMIITELLRFLTSCH